MLIQERREVFLSSLEGGNGAFLDALEQEARKNRVPVIRPPVQRLLKVLLAAARPSGILEIGTAVGFSALLMASCTPENCRITTIERDPDRAAAARRNFEGRRDRITLLEGDAARILPGLKGSYEFIFMDAAKGQYLPFLREVLRLLSPGGMLVSDNVLQEGDILESHFLVERRDRTIYRRMRDYLRALTGNRDLVTTILPVADGVAVSVRKATETTGVLLRKEAAEDE